MSSLVVLDYNSKALPGSEPIEMGTIWKCKNELKLTRHKMTGYRESKE